MVRIWRKLLSWKFSVESVWRSWFWARAGGKDISGYFQWLTERKQKLTTGKLERTMGWMLAPDSSLFQNLALLKTADCSISSLYVTLCLFSLAWVGRLKNRDIFTSEHVFCWVVLAIFGADIGAWILCGDLVWCRQSAGEESRRKGKQVAAVREECVCSVCVYSLG